MTEVTSVVTEYAQACFDEAVSLLETLAQIPAPSGNEHSRAVFCRDWLCAQGADQTYIDEACNVICPVGVTQENPLAVICAHSDVVFPDTTTLPLEQRDGRMFCPGVGDDTANVVALLMAAKYAVKNRLVPSDYGVLFVIDAGEEGLGNLKGIRHLMATFWHRVREFLSFDCYAREVIAEAVGSRRFSISVETTGGHSYFDFGADNAIAVLSAIVGDLYRIEAPVGTTYNVGQISGGTSVNTIAQRAELLFEFRSDSRVNLAEMQAKMDAILACYDGVQVTLLGERPCAGDVDAARQAALVNRATDVLTRHFGQTPTIKAGSTDCNIPLSMGIPSVCFGCVLGGGMHTREEYVETASLRFGIAAALETVLHYF